jgi:hypothetical protein
VLRWFGCTRVGTEANILCSGCCAAQNSWSSRDIWQNAGTREQRVEEVRKSSPRPVASSASGLHRRQNHPWPTSSFSSVTSFATRHITCSSTRFPDRGPPPHYHSPIAHHRTDSYAESQIPSAPSIMTTAPMNALDPPWAPESHHHHYQYYHGLTPGEELRLGPQAHRQPHFRWRGR